MKLAVASFSFDKLYRAGKIDLFGYLETCRYRLGLSTADIWNGMLLSTEEDYVRKVKEALRERELTLVNLAVDWAAVWDDDPATRERNSQNALAHLQAAEALGARTVRIDAGGAREATAWTEEQFDWITERYRAYARRAHDHGYRVGPENHWGPEGVPANLVRLCQAVDHPGFGVLLHLGRWRGAEAERGDALVAPWAMHTHLGRQVADDALEGRMAALRDAGYGGYWSVEHWADQYSEIEQRLAAVRGVLMSWQAGAPGGEQRGRR